MKDQLQAYLASGDPNLVLLVERKLTGIENEAAMLAEKGESTCCPLCPVLSPCWNNNIHTLLCLVCVVVAAVIPTAELEAAVRDLELAETEAALVGTLGRLRVVLERDPLPSAMNKRIKAAAAMHGKEVRWTTAVQQEYEEVWPCAPLLPCPSLLSLCRLLITFVAPLVPDLS